MLLKTKKKLTGFLTKNFIAKQNKEHDLFVAFKGEKFDQCTDFIFNHDGSIKSINSELSKREVKKLLSDIIDEFYKPY